MYYKNVRDLNNKINNLKNQKFQILYVICLFLLKRG